MQKKRKRNHNKELELIHRGELMLKSTCLVASGAMLDRAEAERDVSRAQVPVVCKDLQIARLTRMLRRAKNQG